MNNSSYKPYVAIHKGAFLNQFYPQTYHFQKTDNPATG